MIYRGGEQPSGGKGLSFCEKVGQGEKRTKGQNRERGSPKKKGPFRSYEKKKTTFRGKDLTVGWELPTTGQGGKKKGRWGKKKKLGTNKEGKELGGGGREDEKKV